MRRMVSILLILELIMLLLVLLFYRGAEAREDEGKFLNYDYAIVINYFSGTLYIFDVRSPLTQITHFVRKFEVGIPAFMPSQFPLTGYVQMGEIYPRWFPPFKLRRFYELITKEVLPEVVEPYNVDLRNFYGVAKVDVLFPQGGYLTHLTISGTSDPASVAHHTLCACVIMQNKDIEKLINIIENRKAFVVLRP